MNNPIDTANELIKDYNNPKTSDLYHNITIGYIEGRLDSWKEELEFLESFDWTISRDASIEGKHKTINLGFIEHFSFIQEDQENKIARIRLEIKDLQSAIKILEDGLK